MRPASPTDRIHSRLAVMRLDYYVAPVLSITILFGTLSQAHAIDKEQISKVKSDIVNRMCAHETWLTCYGEKPQDCRRIAEEIATPCVQKHLEPVVHAMDIQYAATLSGRIVKCLNERFFETRKKPEELSAECKLAVRHLL